MIYVFRKCVRKRVVRKRVMARGPLTGETCYGIRVYEQEHGLVIIAVSVDRHDKWHMCCAMGDFAIAMSLRCHHEIHHDRYIATCCHVSVQHVPHYRASVCTNCVGDM